MSTSPPRNNSSPPFSRRDDDGTGHAGARVADESDLPGTGTGTGSGSDRSGVGAVRAGDDKSVRADDESDVHGGAARHGASAAASERQSVVAREKDRYGGIKWGSAFFGWLTATGTAVILTAILLAAGATVGAVTGADAADARDNAATVGLAGGLALLGVILVAYFCGGYVAGRMARFNGVKQGVAVWIWAVVIAAAVAIAGAVLGDKYDLLDRIGGFPRLPIGGDDVTTGSIVAVAIALVAALVGAVLGGLAGMRFHRKVDRAGFGH